jgi:cytochrome c-type biogenesis protein
MLPRLESSETMLDDAYIYLGVGLAGFVSFLSPCVLPLVPPYLSYLGGTTIEQVSANKPLGKAAWRRTLLAAIFFVLGFTTVFVTLGATASAMGQLLQTYLRELSFIAGIIIILFGLHFAGILRFAVLYQEARFRFNTQATSFWGAYLMGLAFAFGWTPCIGPVLAAVLTLTMQEASLGAGVRLLIVYSLGLGIPFILAAAAIRPFLALMQRFHMHLGRVEKVMGVLLVLTGVLILSGSMNWFGQWLLDNAPVLGRIEEWVTPKGLRSDIVKQGQGMHR